MSGGEGDWSSPHWRQAGRGGRQAGGRAGPSGSHYNRSQQHYEDHQYGDRRQQGPYHGDRGFPHRGQHQGGPYGSFAHHVEGFSSQHYDHIRQGYSHHSEHHPHAGFRGPPARAHFNPGEGRPPGYLHYPQDPMMAGPPRLPEHWHGGPSYPHPSVAPQAIHAQFARPSALMESPQFPATQTFPHHRVAGGPHIAGMSGVGSAATLALGGNNAMMPGSVFHPSAARNSQHAGAWASGAPGPEQRSSEAARGGGGGPGRGGSGRGGGQGRGAGGNGSSGTSSTSASSFNARRTSRAPPVPQPLVPNASSQGEPANSGILSLGRPRQQPSSTVNNVQSARGEHVDTAPANGCESGAKPEGEMVIAANERQANGAAAIEPTPAREASSQVAGVEAEYSTHGTASKSAPASSVAGEEPRGVIPAIDLGEAGGALADIVSVAAGFYAVRDTGGDTESNGQPRNSNLSPGPTPVAPESVHSLADMHAAGPSHSAAQESNGFIDGSVETPALRSSAPQVSPLPPQEAVTVAPATVQAPNEKLAVSGGGSAWCQRPATALFASGGPAAAATGHVPARKPNAQPPHGAITQQALTGGYTTVAMVAGAQPAAGSASAPAANTALHQNCASSSTPAPSAVAPPPRMQNRPTPLQASTSQGLRCPPPGFGATPVALGSPVGTGNAPGGLVPLSPKLDPTLQAQQPPQQLSPGSVPEGRDAPEPAASPVGAAQVQQHSSAVATVSPAPTVSSGLADPSEVSKANRKWALVAAAPGSSGGTHTKAMPSRPISERGNTDSSTAVAAATLVGLRNAAHHGPGAGPLVSVAPTDSIVVAAQTSAGTDEVNDGNSAKARCTTPEAVSAAPHPVACAEGPASNGSLIPEASLAEGAQVQHGVQRAVSQVATLSPTASSALRSKVESVAAAPACATGSAVATAAAAVLVNPPATVAPAAALAPTPRELPSGITQNVNGAAPAAMERSPTSPSPPASQLPVPRNWSQVAVSSSNKDPTSVPRPSARTLNPRRTGAFQYGNVASGPTSVVIAGAATDHGVTPAGTVKLVADPIDASISEGQPAASTAAVAAERGPREVQAAPTRIEDLRPDADSGAKDGAVNLGIDVPTPASLSAATTEGAPREAREGPSGIAPTELSPVVTVAAPAEPLAAAAVSVESAAAPGSAPAAPTPKTWASIATRSGPVSGSVIPLHLKPNSVSRGPAPRISRNMQLSHRDKTAQPPEGMFLPYVTGPAPQGTSSPCPSKPSTDEHDGQGPSGNSAGPILKASRAGLKSPKLASPMMPDSADSAPSVAAAAHTNPSSATTELFTVASAHTSAQELASPMPTKSPSGVGAVQPATIMDIVTKVSTSSAASVDGEPATAAAETAAALQPRHEPHGAAQEGSTVQQADDDESSWHRVGPRHKTSKGADVHAHPGHNAGAAGVGAGRGRGRHVHAAGVAAVPNQRSGAAAHGHHPQQGGRSRVAAGHPPQQGPQLSVSNVGKLPATAPAAVQVATTAAVILVASPISSAPHSSQVGCPGAQADANGVPVALAALVPAAVPAASPLEAAAAKESETPVPTAGHDQAVTPSCTDVPLGEVAAVAAALEPSSTQAAALVDREAATESIEATAAVPVDAPIVSAEPAADAGNTSAQADAVKKASQQEVQARGSVSSKKDRREGSVVATREEEEEGKAEQEEEDDGTPTIPPGSNPWDLLGDADEDGSVAASGGAAKGSVTHVAEAGAAGLSSTSDSILKEALKQLLTPATAEQLLAGSRQQQQSGFFRLQPRGLTNTGNTCFINATMQALLACTPFAFALSRLPAIAPLLEPSKSPTLHGLALFLAELAAPNSGASTSWSAGPVASGRDEPQQAAEDEGWAEVPSYRGKKGGQRKGAAAKQLPQSASPVVAATSSTGSSSSTVNKAESAGPLAVVLGGQPLVPSMLSGIAAAFNPRISIAEKQTMAKVLSKGVVEQEQQDAQEFFQFLVNQVHEEVVALRKAHGLAAGSAASSAGAAGGENGEEWAQVGRKNKATVTRQVGAPADDASSRTPVTAIFSGQLKSTVRFQQPTYKPSATIEAFNMLHLDIAAEGVNTLEDALRQHTVPENIEYKPDGASEMLPAKKDVRLYRLPEVLVLHLKRFTYTAAGGGRYTKVQKPVTFNCTLRLEGKILADDCPDRANSEYRLFATINHHGRTIAGGHYLADVLQADGRWLRFNDAEVFVVPESAVLGERPYLLFYQRIVQRGA